MKSNVLPIRNIAAVNASAIPGQSTESLRDANLALRNLLARSLAVLGNLAEECGNHSDFASEHESEARVLEAAARLLLEGNALVAETAPNDTGAAQAIVVVEVSDGSVRCLSSTTAATVVIVDYDNSEEDEDDGCVDIPSRDGDRATVAAWSCESDAASVLFCNDIAALAAEAA